MSALILDCPSCGRKLRVPDELLGKPVKCPTCEHTFQTSDAPGSTAALGMPPPLPETPDQPSRPCPRCGETNDQDAARCRYCGQELQDEADDRPWDEPRGFQGRRDAEPHRGTLILVLGIVSIVMVVLCGPVGLPLGIAAWVMGRRDLNKMRENLMDREGEGLTQAGWICGIIGTIIDSIWLVCLLGYIGLVFTMVTGVRRAPPPPMPPPVPAPVRPAPVPGPGPVGNRGPHEARQRLLDSLPAPNS